MGMYFLNRTQLGHKLRQIMNKWDYIKLKKLLYNKNKHSSEA